MSVFVVLIAGAIQVNLLLALVLLALVLLGIVVHRRYERTDVRADHGGAVPITDEVDVAAAVAETAAAAAERAQDEAEQAQHAAVWAAAARDIAEQRHRSVLKRAEAAGESDQLVQRAALDAYQRGQLSVAELNRIWQYAQVVAEAHATPRSAGLPLGWELRVREARRRYEHAEAEAMRAEDDARRKAATAEALATEARAAESLHSVAVRSASTGLVGLLRANWADPAIS